MNRGSLLLVINMIGQPTFEMKYLVVLNFNLIYIWSTLSIYNLNFSNMVSTICLYNYIESDSMKVNDFFELRINKYENKPKWLRSRKSRADSW